ncbi:RluA family pseudouridine synthase [Candidatus Nomurabacteria bacterium]|nr:RluA family pseudouridine synthase [Candidatus Nomurabacteria bacterium]
MPTKIKILYEDSNILAIEKPSGISVHFDGKSKEKTIADWVLEKYPKMKNVGEDEVYENKNIKTNIKKPGIVHRLDRETSGVLLLAKNQKAYKFLKNQFQNKEIKKTYVAIVSGSVKNDRGIINKPIGRSPTDFRRYSAGRGARGEMREATTQYKVLKRFEAEHSKFTYLEIYPKTGRTHQIRVHMKYLNHPVVCDSLYNPDNPCPKGIKRMALHAKSIEFKDLKGNTLKIESSVPKEFIKLQK